MIMARIRVMPENRIHRFSRYAMRDLDNIKKFQLLYLDQYQGESKDAIRKTLFSEVAGWFFVYVQKTLNYLNEVELIALIEETLSQPSFVLAREYYMNTPEDHWDAVDLLRKGDAHEYITKAKEYRKGKRIKDNIRNTLKQIYAHL